MILICCLKKKDTEDNGALKVKGARSEKPKEDFGSGVQDAEKNKLVFFEGSTYNFDLEDLLRASAEVLGKGSYGTTYKAILEEGTAVVVKRLKEVVAGRREFEQQMEAGKSCSSSFGRTPLDWESRVKISLGAARGIAHIHSAGGGKIIHGNIKSSNVLLTLDLRGCISDFGLAPIMSYLRSHLDVQATELLR
ncbi:hypothetical protein GH714_019860 [Hevea brasiliensis]|uniref:Protein kinase domain-containing protein n=1 Tax=Hevea brasiliensis TaxID=3981 RepID=A0A6A6LYX6_HEVBR|nr:hypothetical protein GH714_019860 [Hevea brasiliensis]